MNNTEDDSVDLRYTITFDEGQIHCLRYALHECLLAQMGRCYRYEGPDRESTDDLLGHLNNLVEAFEEGKRVFDISLPALLR